MGRYGDRIAVPMASSPVDRRVVIIWRGTSARLEILWGSRPNYGAPAWLRAGWSHSVGPCVEFWSPTEGFPAIRSLELANLVFSVVGTFEPPPRELALSACTSVRAIEFGSYELTIKGDVEGTFDGRGALTVSQA